MKRSQLMKYGSQSTFLLAAFYGFLGAVQLAAGSLFGLIGVFASVVSFSQFQKMREAAKAMKQEESDAQKEDQQA